MSNQRRAFSFTEILFAVMIIAIGFIMIAAMFPVALKQTENSVSDTTAAAIAHQGMTFVDQLSSSTFVSASQPINPLRTDQYLAVLTPTVRFPSNRNAWRLWQSIQIPDAVFFGNFPTITPRSTDLTTPPNGIPYNCTMPGEMWPLDFQQVAPFIDQARAVNGIPVAGTPQLFRDVVYQMSAQNQLQTNNPKYAWVGFYKRDLTAYISWDGVKTAQVAHQAQVVVIVVQNKNADAFTSADLVPGTGQLSPTRYDGCQLIPPNSPTTLVGGITLPTGPGDRSATGAFVVISNDNVPTNSVLHGAFNGHVYRLGTRIPGTSNSWEFIPGFTITAGEAKTLSQIGGTSFSVYMIGMGHDPQNPAAFSGPAMDVASYSGFIQVNRD